MKRNFTRILGFVLILSATALYSQTPYQLDTTFQVDMDGLVDNYNGFIMDFLVEEDQSIIIVGSFGHRLNGQLARDIVKLSPDGSIDHSFYFDDPYPTQWSNNIDKHDGMYYLGHYGKPGVSRIFMDGTVDTSFKFPYSMFFVGAVQASDIYVYPDGRVLVSGLFLLSPSSGWGLFRLHPDGSIDSTFHSTLVGKYMDDILPLRDGKFLISGNRYDMQLTRRCFWRIHPDGTLDTTFNTGAVGLTGLYADTVPGTDKYIVCGVMDIPGISQTLTLVRLNSDGSLDTTFNNFNEFDYAPSRVLYQGDKILVGAGFTSINGIACNSLAVFDTLGNLDTALTATLPGPDSSDYYFTVGVNEIQKQGEKILCSGTFTSFDGHPTFCITRLFDLSVGIKEEQASREFRLCPNPARDHVNMEFIHPFSGEYQLLDLSGRSLHSGTLPTSRQSHKLTLPKLATGVYLLHVRSTEGWEYVEKLVVE